MKKSPEVTVAICCYNAANYLSHLLDLLVKQPCNLSWEILIVDNNSSDKTEHIINEFSLTSNIPIRYVKEQEQGIPFARNRAIEECKSSLFLAFIDADELPDEHWLTSAVNRLQDNEVDCVGGAIDLDLHSRPAWLCDSLLPFLGQVNHGHLPFQIIDRSTPIWSGNIAYRLSLFAQGLRFDTRYNRKGKGVGGGSDGILFRKLLAKNCKMFYEPEMRIVHLIPKDKLTRSYFLRLHYIAGKKFGLYELNDDTSIKFLGIPRYMFMLFAKQSVNALKLFVTRDSEYMRETMNVSHLLGQMIGLAQQHKLNSC